MSEIPTILKKLEGTSEYQILTEIEAAYERIAQEQKEWYEKSGFLCPQGCGDCCSHFEPDLMVSEALYMGAWLLEHQPVIAYSVAEENFPFYAADRCQFFNPDSPYHCSIYGGRAFICRLFGASGVRSKSGDLVWKPCRFYPSEQLAKHIPPLQHRQYSSDELMQIFGTLPPNMGDLMSGTDADTALIRDILPKIIRHLLFIIGMNDNGSDNPNGTPNGSAA